MISLLALALAADRVPVHGVMTGADGQPLSGTFPVTFYLHDAPTGGTELHFEVQSVTFDQGRFSAILGTNTPFDPSDLRRDGDIYLSVQTGGGAPSARAEVGWAPRAVYAARAGEAATAEQAANAALLDNHPASYFLPAGDAWTPGSGFTLVGKSFTVDPTPFAAASHNHTMSAITGTLGVTQGGTGLSAGPTAAGQFLRASGAGTWAASAISAGDLPSTLSPSTVNATTVSSTHVTASGVLTAGGLRQEGFTRDIGPAVGDWVSIGQFTASTGIYARLVIWGHWGETLFVNSYDLTGLLPYAGATTDWVQVPPTFGRGWQNGAENITVDMRISAQGQPIEVRLRRLTVANAVGTVSVALESNQALTPATSSGSAGTVATGLLSRPGGFAMPVSTNRFSASTEGLFMTGAGDLGVGVTNPAAKLHVNGLARYKVPVFQADGGSAHQLYSVGVLKFTGEQFDTYNNYDPSTGRFTASVPGIYHCYVDIDVHESQSTGAAWYLRKNGSNFLLHDNYDKSGTWKNYHLAGYFQLAVNDWVDVALGGDLWIAMQNWSKFGCSYISDL